MHIDKIMLIAILVYSAITSSFVYADEPAFKVRCDFFERSSYNLKSKSNASLNKDLNELFSKWPIIPVVKKCLDRYWAYSKTQVENDVYFYKSAILSRYANKNNALKVVTGNKNLLFDTNYQTYMCLAKKKCKEYSDDFTQVNTRLKTAEFKNIWLKLEAIRKKRLDVMYKNKGFTQNAGINTFTTAMHDSSNKIRLVHLFREQNNQYTASIIVGGDDWDVVFTLKPDYLLFEQITH